MANARDQARTGAVTIATVRIRSEAFHLVRQLEAAGIECTLLEERLAAPSGNDRLASGGIKVQVDRGDVKRAIEHLRLHHYDVNAVAQPAAPRKQRRRHGGGWGRVILEGGLLLGVATLLAALFFVN